MDTSKLSRYDWVVVAGIQVVLILLTSEEPNRALQPAILAVGVPAALYLLGLVVERVRRKP